MHVYHRVPEQMQGRVLYPLNELPSRFPDAHSRQVAKYNGREWLKQARVLSLDCLWGDVVFMSAVHPGEIKEGLSAAGFPVNRFGEFFEIDVAQLDPKSMAVYRHSKPAHNTIPPGEFVHFQRQHLKSYARLPDAARAYWAMCAAQSEKPMAFGFIPHILHRGPINVSSCPVISP